MKRSTSTTTKLAIIFALVIIMLIPQLSIMDLIRERSGYKQQVQHVIANQWGGQQQIMGPILAIPYYEQKPDNSLEKHYAYFLPDELKANSNIEVEELEKSIYKIPVFSSTSNFAFSFSSPDMSNWDIDEKNILWDHAILMFNVGDPKGILDNPALTLNSGSKKFEPGQPSRIFSKGGMYTNLKASEYRSGFTGKINFNIKGSQGFHIIPVGKETSYSITSNWPHPNFQGFNEGFSPVYREVKGSGFSASWKATKFNAGLAYRWRDGYFEHRGQYMGVEFVQVADHYTKSERSIKYMVLVIGLIFLSFLVSELINKMRIHPFQYILVGSAIVVFYVLLLAIAEYVGYNTAYLISATASIILISIYCLSIFGSTRLVLLETLILVALFTFLFVIINAIQYSLLIGAVGLFVILALTMYFTRKIQWYKDEEKQPLVTT